MNCHSLISDRRIRRGASLATLLAGSILPFSTFDAAAQTEVRQLTPQELVWSAIADYKSRYNMKNLDVDFARDWNSAAQALILKRNLQHAPIQHKIGTDPTLLVDNFEEWLSSESQDSHLYYSTILQTARVLKNYNSSYTVLSDQQFVGLWFRAYSDFMSSERAAEEGWCLFPFCNPCPKTSNSSVSVPASADLDIDAVPVTTDEVDRLRSAIALHAAGSDFSRTSATSAIFIDKWNALAEGYMDELSLDYARLDFSVASDPLPQLLDGTLRIEGEDIHNHYTNIIRVAAELRDSDHVYSGLTDLDIVENWMKGYGLILRTDGSGPEGPCIYPVCHTPSQFGSNSILGESRVFDIGAVAARDTERLRKIVSEYRPVDTGLGGITAYVDFAKDWNAIAERHLIEKNLNFASIEFSDASEGKELLSDFDAWLLSRGEDASVYYGTMMEIAGGLRQHGSNYRMLSDEELVITWIETYKALPLMDGSRQFCLYPFCYPCPKPREKQE